MLAPKTREILCDLHGPHVGREDVEFLYDRERRKQRLRELSEVQQLSHREHKATELEPHG